MAIIRKNGGAHGASLVEAIVAIGLSGIVIATSLSAITSAAAGLAAQRIIDTAIDLARTQLEQAVALPCTADTPCSEPFSCTTTREVISAPSTTHPVWVLRLTTVVRSDTDSSVLPNALTLTTVVTHTAPCPA